MDPNQEDDFIDEDLAIRDYLRDIISSFKETSNKKFILNLNQDLNSKKLQNLLKLFMV